jgi:hypothetical protein
MPRFILTYLGGERPQTKEAGQKHMQDFMAWVQGLGGAAISPMNPIGPSSFVSSGGVTQDWAHPKMSGYTVIEAEDKQAAIEAARSCPFLETGGTMEVAELINMNN